jgi:hypothetical protein
LYYKWRGTFLENTAKIFSDPRDREQQRLEDRVAELERMIGQLTIENNIINSQKLTRLNLLENGS